MLQLFSLRLAICYLFYSCTRLFHYSACSYKVFLPSNFYLEQHWSSAVGGVALPGFCGSVFAECFPLPNLLSGSTLPPPCVKEQYLQTLCGWEGSGLSSPVGDHILQEFNTLYLTRYTTYKIARPPNKNLGGEWASCCKVPSKVNLFGWRHFALLISHCSLQCFFVLFPRYSEPFPRMFISLPPTVLPHVLL